MARIYTIYKAISPSGKIYIGYTKDLRKRKWGHNGAANAGNNNHICAAIRKYGFKTIEWVILDENLTLEEAKNKEIGYIKEYDSFKKGYNMTHGGDTVDVEKVIARYKDVKLRELLSLRKGVKPFYICDLKGNIIEEFRSIALCTEKYRLQGSNIGRCLKNNRKTHKGYTFRYVS